MSETYRSSFTWSLLYSVMVTLALMDPVGLNWIAFEIRLVRIYQILPGSGCSTFISPDSSLDRSCMSLSDIRSMLAKE